MPEAAETITPQELADVLARYDLGEVASAREVRRGSRQSPKVLVTTERGSFLLKRRAPGRDDPERVAFSHAIQIELASRRFPVPRLLGTRGDRNTMVELHECVYELFEFSPGSGYDGSPEPTRDAGRALAFFHRLLGRFRSEWAPPRGTYHTPGVTAETFAMAATFAPHAAGLRDRYLEAADLTRVCSGWPEQIIHADWHPGNMLFDAGRVSAVLDLDAARLAPRAIDLANALLQFGMSKGTGGDWPPSLDEDRLLSLAGGYESVEGCTISSAELAAIPWLMIQALIAEAVIPIAQTGRFGDRDPGPISLGVLRASEFIRTSRERLTDRLASVAPAP